MPTIEEQGGLPGIILSAVQKHYADKSARKKELSDEQHQATITDLIGKRKSLIEKIPTLKGTPDYEPALKSLQEVETGLRELYHPANNPGAIAKFGHLLTDHLGIKRTDPTLGTKVSLSDYREGKKYDKNQAALAGDLAKAQQDIAAGPLTPEQQAGVDASISNAEKDATIAWLKKNNAPKEVIDQAVANYDRVTGKEPEEQWTDVKGALPQEYPVGSGQYRVLKENKKSGESKYFSEPDGYAPTAPSVKTLPTFAQTRVDYMNEKGIPPGTPLTLKDDEEIKRRMAIAGNPYGQAHIDLEKQGLGMREREANVKDTMALVKQFTPLDRIVHISEEADSDVSNPTGPGDVALTLAFFDAIKTTGVRFTQTEQNFIVNSRGLVENAKAAYEKGFEGTIYGPSGSEQRKTLADIVKKAADVAKKQKGNLISGVGQFNPQAAAAAGGTGTSTLPPNAIAKLKEGLITTFSNNQKWTLKNGKPEQVQ